MTATLKILKWLIILDMASGVVISFAIGMGWINPADVVFKIAAWGRSIG